MHYYSSPQCPRCDNIRSIQNVAHLDTPHEESPQLLSLDRRPSVGLCHRRWSQVQEYDESLSRLLPNIV
jgi:hypothetical protein